MIFSGGVLLTVLVWLLAVALDQRVGEVKRGHPLVVFGTAAAHLEKRCNSAASPFTLYLKGALSWSLLILSPVAGVFFLDRYAASEGMLLWLLLHIVVLYFAIGWRSMVLHIEPISLALARGDPTAARQSLALIVSRDTSDLSEQEVVCASLESLLENSSDALFASLFWYAVLGPTGVVLHRLSNTLDAMWGYRSSRFEYFGKWAARADDALNFMPAQLTALGFAVCARSRRCLQCWWRQGWRWKSINAGSVMASGAAALSLSLGGSASYEGESQQRAQLGAGRPAEQGDLRRGVLLVNRVFLLQSFLLAGVWLCR